MPTFAHTENGYALDCKENDTVEEYLKRYDPKITQGWQVEKVTDGTIDGAMPDGHGGWVNPEPAAPPPSQPLPLSKTAFQDLAVANLGGALTGMARFQAIMDGCASGSGAVKFCFSRYEAAQTFDKTQVANFTAIMVSAAIMIQAEADAILKNWPTK